MRHVVVARNGMRDHRRLSLRCGRSAALSLILAACGGGVTTTGYEPLPPTSMPLRTAVASSAPDATASGSHRASSNHLPRGPLEAGTYVSAYMVPSLEFTVPDGFSLKDEDTDLVHLTSGPDRFPPDFAIFRVANQGVVDTLVDLPTLRVSRATDVTYPIGTGTSIDIQAAAADSIDVAIGRTADKDAGFFLALGARGRVFEFAVEGAVLIVLFTATANQFERYAPDAEAIAASIAIAGP